MSIDHFLDSPFGFALNQTFNSFMKKWPLKLDKKTMLEIWSKTICNKNIKPEDIREATEYCLNHLNGWPPVYKFRVYCERAANKEPLNKPVITKAEELAHELLINLIKKDAEFLEKLPIYFDAFLVAALAAHTASNQRAGMAHSVASAEIISYRMGMFVKELSSWVKTAENEGDFWLAHFLKTLNLK